MMLKGENIASDARCNARGKKQATSRRQVRMAIYSGRRDPAQWRTKADRGLAGTRLGKERGARGPLLPSGASTGIFLRHQGNEGKRNEARNFNLIPPRRHPLAHDDETAPGVSASIEPSLLLPRNASRPLIRPAILVAAPPIERDPTVRSAAGLAPSPSPWGPVSPAWEDGAERRMCIR